MVTLRGRVHGLDLLPGSFRLATLAAEPGRMLIESLQELPERELCRDRFDAHAELYFAVPDAQAVVKLVKPPNDPTLNADKTALFELLTALPEEADHYFLETYALNGCPQRLAVAYHRKLVEEQIERLEKAVIRPSGFRLRSLALAEGYRKFCRPLGGDLVCLLHIDRHQTLLAFLNHGVTVATGFLECSFPDADDSAAMKSALIDIAALVRYRNSLLFKEGFTAPLSLVILCGERADTTIAEPLSQLLRVKIAFPEFRTELFADSAANPSALFLVGLGLTVVS